MYETDVFISYKRVDASFATELKSRLEAKNHIVWLDQYIPYGREWRATINNHLENTLLVVVVTSPDSMTSAYVTYEWCYACLTLGKDFHWIQIAECDMEKGMFGLLMDKRQAPLRCSSNNPTDDEWERVISSVENRLTGIKSIRQAGELLLDLNKSDDLQKGAAEHLGKVNDPFHVPLARQILLKGLKKHTRTTGKVSGEIVRALSNMGDLSVIPYLITFLDQKHEDEIDAAAKALLRNIAEQNS